MQQHLKPKCWAAIAASVVPRLQEGGLPGANDLLPPQDGELVDVSGSPTLWLTIRRIGSTMERSSTVPVAADGRRGVYRK